MKYYSLVLSKDKKEADINIFGDITSYANEDLGEVSSVSLAKQIEQLQDTNIINVHINSYGGDVSEGLAIYNTLKNHKAKIKTYCDGFCCSIASVIFMAGDERIMSKASLLMIHNAWTIAEGNANELRKYADDLDKITSASINAYLERINIDKEQLQKLMDSETWLTHEEALKMGFATSVGNKKESKVSQCLKSKLIDLILFQSQSVTIGDEDTENEKREIMGYKCQKCGYIHEGEMPEFFICPKCGADKEQFEPIEEDINEPVEEVTEDEKDEEETMEQPTNDEEKPNKDDEEVINEKLVAFFNAISK